MGRFSKIALLALLVVILRPIEGFGMNDTDGIRANGLFPLDDEKRSLRLLSEVMQVMVSPAGIETTWTYEIQNNLMEEREFQVGAICSYFDLVTPCGRIVVDGEAVEVKEAVSYLVDEGAKVGSKPLTREQFEACMENNDGIICGHKWISGSIRFHKGQVRRVMLADPPSIMVSSITEAIGTHLVLYTEKFWYDGRVPRVSVMLGLQGGKFRRELFVPRGFYKDYSIPPDGEEEGMLLWRFENHAAGQTAGTSAHVLYLINPLAIDNDGILEAIASNERNQLRRDGRKSSNNASKDH
jgi:hypothetical protein